MENLAAPAFTVDGPAGPALEALRRRFRIREEPRVRRHVTYFDTFDWRLFNDGGTLSRSSAARGTTLRWRNLDGSLRHRLVTRAEPGFAGDLPRSALRSALAPIVGIRRLLPVVDLELCSRTFRILNDDDKTVVRLRLDEPAPGVAAGNGEGPGGLPSSCLRVLPVRGYDDDRDRALEVLRAEAGLAPATIEPATILAAGGRTPGAYSSKVRILLDPECPAAEAMVRIHRRLLEVVRANEDGVRRDLDSEFLHDFRVAVRRTRSALTQVKGVFPAAAVSHFKQEFAWLGKVTGPTRDLDVYLLKFGEYQRSLPRAVRADLAPLREFLERRQRREHALLAAALDGERYRRLLADWQAFLGGRVSGGGDPEAGPPQNASRPVLRVAGKRIRKAFRRVVRKGTAIDDGTPDEALHELRIDCKKLRYLMEFFRSLYDPAEIGRSIRALKKLQDNLGDFNDFVVQQEQLRRFAREMADEGSAAPVTLMAMGRLVERLEQGHAEERRRFHRRFDRFATPANRERARALFAPGK